MFVEFRRSSQNFVLNINSLGQKCLEMYKQDLSVRVIKYFPGAIYKIIESNVFLFIKLMDTSFCTKDDRFTLMVINLKVLL